MSTRTEFTPVGEQHEIVQVQIAALSEKGEGIAYYQDYEVYVQGALPGEQVRIRLHPPFVRGSQRRPGELLGITARQNPYRNAGACPYVGRCGGCTLGLYDYAGQLQCKEQDLRGILEELRLPAEVWAGFCRHSAGQCWRYKSIRYFGRISGQLRQGFYAVRSHDLCPVAECRAEPEWMSELAGSLAAGLQYSDLPIKALLMRDLGEQRLAVMICQRAAAPRELSLLTPVFERHALNSVQLLINPGDDNALLHGKTFPLWGPEFIRTSLCGLKFEVGAQTFLQVNPQVCVQLYQDAVQFCQEAGGSGEALDLCCGIGIMSLMLAQHFSSVVGVEIVPQSVQAARVNAELNGVHNLEFVAADLSAVLPDLLRPQVRAVICDPSRAGIGQHNCSLLGRLSPGSRLCYIFCSLKALKRDLPELIKAGFSVSKVRAYDMFPFTRMLETAVFLVKA